MLQALVSVDRWSVDPIALMVDSLGFMGAGAISTLDINSMRVYGASLLSGLQQLQQNCSSPVHVDVSTSVHELLCTVWSLLCEKVEQVSEYSPTFFLLCCLAFETFLSHTDTFRVKSLLRYLLLNGSV